VPKKNEINETKGKRTEYENTYNKVWAIRSPGDSSKFSLACCRTSREFGLYNLPSRTLSIPLNEWLATFLRLIAPHGRKTTHSRTSIVHILIFRSPRRTEVNATATGTAATVVTIQKFVNSRVYGTVKPDFCKSSRLI